MFLPFCTNELVSGLRNLELFYDSVNSIELPSSFINDPGQVKLPDDSLERLVIMAKQPVQILLLPMSEPLAFTTTMTVPTASAQPCKHINNLLSGSP